MTPCFRQRENGPPFQILFYHRIQPCENPYAIDAITTADFAQQTAMLSSAFNLMTMSELVESLEQGAVPPKTACITFDDGYRDNFEFAFPILQRYRAPATIFIATDYIGSGKMLWPDILLATLKHTTRSKIPAELLGEPLPLGTQVDRATAAEMLLDRLKQFAPEERDRRLDQLQSWCGAPPVEKRRLMLDWDEVVSMSAAGIEFGSHTVTHPILSHASDEEIDYEIAESKKEIECHVKKPVTAFAYPNGRLDDFDERAIAALKRHGYTSAVTTGESVNDATARRYAMSRESVWDMDANRLFVRMLFERLRYAQGSSSPGATLVDHNRATLRDSKPELKI